MNNLVVETIKAHDGLEEDIIDVNSQRSIEEVTVLKIYVGWLRIVFSLKVKILYVKTLIKSFLVKV